MKASRRLPLLLATPPLFMLSGCGALKLSVINHAGPIAASQWHLYVIVGIVLVFVAGPVLVLTPLVAWHYRLSNKNDAYRPKWNFSWTLEGFIWIPPTGIVIGLGFVLWHYTHTLDPYRPIASNQPPLEIQVVGFDWKWLFIYPDERIAAVNKMVIPVGRPVYIRLTSGTVMQSLMIPQLAGQIYAMAGMTTQLNLAASRTGVYRGENTQFNGTGFQNEKFNVVALSPADYDRWVKGVQASSHPLDAAAYAGLFKKSSPPQPIMFSSVPPHLFQQILAKSREPTMTEGIWPLVLGRFNWHALPFVRAWEDPTVSEIIGAGAALIVIVGAVVLVALITRSGKWRYLWSDWLTSLDHKKIGIMYIVLAFVMLSRALIEAVLMRMQQAAAIDNPGFIAPDHFSQLFSTHGSIMIFFMAMPFLTGVINYVMPLQIGSRDVAFPLLNSISLWLTGGAAGLMMVSLVIGKFSTGGWSGYPPYTELAFNPGVGPDYWIWALTLGSIGSTLTGINFAVTIYKMRCPGMNLMRMPLFVWTALCTSILMIFAMPPLTVATALLALDRYLGFHFFTNDLGGNMMNYANLFWLFGHPEVYILILPAFGVYSEVVSTFSTKELYGYTSLVLATMAIAILSFTVWVHHFFTMGQNADINAVFGIATMTIGVPTGVKIYDWIWTMFRGEVRFTVPMLYSLAFMMTFVLGGFTGILLAFPPLDYLVHNTVFLVAHFHNMLIPGLLYGMLAGYHYWFPKAFGFRLSEKWGRISFGCWVVGFYLAFMPLYVLGAAGMARRTQEVFEPSFRPWLYIAGIGALVLLCALASLFVQLWVSIRDRDTNRVFAGDPWDGRGLEWATSAPPPEYNFAVIPHVRDRDPFYRRKRQDDAYAPPTSYDDITLPKNSMTGPVIGVVGAALAFGLVWHMWWLAVIGLLAIIATVIARSFARDVHKVIPAAEVERVERRWLQAVAEASPIPRHVEMTSANQGLAEVSRMSADEVKHAGLNLGDTDELTHEQAGSAVFGFWVFLMSDAVIFALLFATYGVMLPATVGGPTPGGEYKILPAFLETLTLLTSSFTFGMASVAMKHNAPRRQLLGWMAVTLVLGLVFLGLEMHDFATMFGDGAYPTRSGYLSSFFALVPLHGLHVFFGSIWIAVMMVQVLNFGLDARVKINILRLGLFWHFLDIVWIAIFSVVYLQGLIR